MLRASLLLIVGFLASALLCLPEARAQNGQAIDVPPVLGIRQFNSQNDSDEGSGQSSTNGKSSGNSNGYNSGNTSTTNHASNTSSSSSNGGGASMVTTLDLREQSGVSGGANSNASGSTTGSATESGSSPNLGLIRNVLGNRYAIGSILQTPVKQLYQVNIGSEIYYIDDSGRYLLHGDLIDLETQANLTEDNRDSVRLEALQKIPESDLIIYPAQGRTRYVVTVFTDVDCPYCQVLHDYLDEYTRRGIEVRFAAFPQAGMYSLNYRKAVAVWCAADRRQALDRASQGLNIPMSECESPVQEQYMTGMQIGVNSVPSFVLDDGTLISGFVAADNLLRMLEERDKARQTNEVTQQAAMP